MQVRDDQTWPLEGMEEHQHCIQCMKVDTKAVFRCYTRTEKHQSSLHEVRSHMEQI
jgi:hypothetical protein